MTCRALLLASALVLAAAAQEPAMADPSAAAQAAAEFTTGMQIKDASGAPVGVVERVVQTDDGQAAVLVSLGGREAVVPVGQLSRASDGTVLMTTPTPPTAQPTAGQGASGGATAQPVVSAAFPG